MSLPPANPDRRVVAALGLEFMVALRRHYAARPQGRAAIFEAANALAIATATMLAGAGAEAKGVRALFDIAVDQQLGDMERRLGAPTTTREETT